MPAAVRPTARRSRHRSKPSSGEAGAAIVARRASSLSVNVLDQASGSTSTTCGRCDRAITRTRSAPSVARTGRVELPGLVLGEVQTNVGGSADRVRIQPGDRRGNGRRCEHPRPTVHVPTIRDRPLQQPRCDRRATDVRRAHHQSAADHAAIKPADGGLVVDRREAWRSGRGRVRRRYMATPTRAMPASSTPMAIWTIGVLFPDPVVGSAPAPGAAGRGARSRGGTRGGDGQRRR